MFRPTLFRKLSLDSSDYGFDRSRRASLSAEQRRKLSMLRTTSIPTPLTPGPKQDNVIPQKTAVDPIQKLFVEKIREYKKNSAGANIFEPSQEIKDELIRNRAKLIKLFGGKQEDDMSGFPKFEFGEAKIDPIDEQVTKKKGDKGGKK